MPTVDENRLKGNYAAAYVAARLSQECLVRPVAADTDVGIDLYCETVEETKPFLHFWVQVKAGAQCRLLNEGAAATCSFDDAHLKYWDRQLVPVFAALVPVDWPVAQDPTVYIVDVTGHLLEGSSQPLHSKHKWQPGNREDVRRFLTKHVPAASARLQCRNGVVAPIPTLQPQYVKVVPTVPVAGFKDRVLQQVRWTAAFGILSLRATNQLRGENSDFRRVLARVLAAFTEGENWEVFGAQAVSCHVDGQFEQAVEFYNRAIACIESDTRRTDDPEWVEIATDLKVTRHLAELGRGLVQ